MPVAIISDIHGNLEALNEILNYLAAHDIQKINCLGDIVGYGPNPNECVEILSEKCEKVVIGNHDHAAIGLTSTEYFNDFAKISTQWTSNNLTKENKEFLHGLEFSYETENYFAVHSTPSTPTMWHYVLSEIDAQHEFKYFDRPICFIGHSHFPIVFNDQGGFSRAITVPLEKDRKYIVNVGSVGQPRDGNPKTCFCIYHENDHTVEFVRLDYDIDKTRDKIIKAGLPVFLADRLAKGY
ncbi:MAG: metallophosphoesterase [Calditrichales bacterium]|nr:MAG: metallophosphoesterase [Calditrichales bacterium]